MIGIGPAGTGKTYLAMAMALSAYFNKEVSRIILTRPAIEAGEKLGFLPGTMYEKVNPYLRPLYDALYDMVDIDRASRLIEKGVLEIAPLAFMRGRTLNDAFVILDEAQNTASEQMKMFLTRLGFSSKTVVTGDVTQIDLPDKRSSGLVEVQTILKGVKGIKFRLFHREGRGEAPSRAEDHQGLRKEGYGGRSEEMKSEKDKPPSRFALRKYLVIVLFSLILAGLVNIRLPLQSGQYQVGDIAAEDYPFDRRLHGARLRRERQEGRGNRQGRPEDRAGGSSRSSRA